MDADDNLPTRRSDPLQALISQDLDPLSVLELEQRITTLEREIERTRQKMAHAVQHKSSAEALFKR